jgi:hypothetical protein
VMLSSEVAVRPTATLPVDVRKKRRFMVVRVMRWLVWRDGVRGRCSLAQPGLMASQIQVLQLPDAKMIAH